MKKIIAIYEIFGGVIALILVLISLGIIIGYSSNSSIFMPWNMAFGASMIISFILIICLGLAGIMLLRNNKFGYFLSISIQFIQTIIIQTPNFHYQFYAPAGLGISFSVKGVKIISGLGFSYALIFKQQPVSSVFIGLNLISLSLLVILVFLFCKESRSKISSKK